MTGPVESVVEVPGTGGGPQKSEAMPLVSQSP